MIIVTTRQMQQMDKNTIESFGIPGRVLMENAGRGAIEMLSEHFDLEGARGVVRVAGRGNNGGDGFVIGRYLMEMGVSVSFFIHPGPGPRRCRGKYGPGTGPLGRTRPVTIH